MNLVLGGPGCGKTTRLLQIMEEKIATGIPPERIAFVSFTKKAAEEAKHRACAKFKLQPNDLPFFRTLHSLAYHLLGMSGHEVMDKPDWKIIGGALGVMFTDAVIEDGDIRADEDKGNTLRFIDQLARNRCVGVDAQLRESDTNISELEMARYRQTVNEYKTQACKRDYTDMLELYVETGKACPVDIAIVDEGQDLSRLQWRMVKRAFNGVRELFIAGDDDQAIFRWAGADVDTFLSLKAPREVLGHTYRLPRSIYDYSRMLVERISQRFPKSATPRDEVGELRRCTSFEQLPLDAQRTAMILTRNSCFLKHVREWARSEGVPFNTRYGSSVDGRHLAAIVAWERLRKHGEVAVSQFELGAQFLPSTKFDGVGKRAHEMLTPTDLGYDVRKPWFDALRRVPDDDRTYYQAVRRRGYSLSNAPGLYIGTIHSVKGGEADDVMLLPDMSARTFSTYERSKDDEHRVFYVGATRAKQRLFLCAPDTNKSYGL